MLQLTSIPTSPLVRCSQMGFMKVKAPNSHNRKRLAVESRRHASRDDSHMFIIKLPPNMHYYAGPAARNALTDHPASDKLGATAAATTSGNTRATSATSSTPPASVVEASALKANGKKVNGIPLGYTIDRHTHAHAHTQCTPLGQRTGSALGSTVLSSRLPAIWPGLDRAENARDKHRRACA